MQTAAVAGSRQLTPNAIVAVPRPQQLPSRSQKVLSLNRGDPNIDPKYFDPYFLWGPQKWTPNVGKPWIRVAVLIAPHTESPLLRHRTSDLIPSPN